MMIYRWKPRELRSKFEGQYGVADGYGEMVWPNGDSCHYSDFSDICELAASAVQRGFFFRERFREAIELASTLLAVFIGRKS